MVYFTCGACGEQVKKPQVEKHYTQKCRRCNVLTCIDCLKDFHGEEYKTHNQCMSEAQRYSKEGREGWDPTQGQGNKGDKKQQEWMDKLRQLLDSSSTLEPAVRNIVNTISNHDNIPRKRPKFINFVKNIMRNKANMSDVERTWDLFSQALQQPAHADQSQKTPETIQSQDVKQTTETDNNLPEKKKKKKSKSKDQESDLQNGKNVEGSAKKSEEVLQPRGEEVQTKKEKKKKKKGKENESVDEEMETSAPAETKKEKKGKKRKMEEASEESKPDLNGTANDSLMEVDGDEPAAKKSKFDWDSTILQVLAKKGNSMKLKKLKKRCVSEYFVQNPAAHQTPEQIGAKFDKKINKRQKYKIVGEEVSLSNRDGEETSDQKESTNCDNKEPVNKKPVNGDHSKSNGSTMEQTKGLSWNAWEAASLGNDAQTEKFRRLMGIKTNVKPQELAGIKKRDDRKIFRDLEQGFERARDSHFRAKGMGLGFN